MCVVFFQPFNATRINASGIENRVRELQKETGKPGKESDKENKGKAGFWEEFEVGSVYQC